MNPFLIRHFQHEKIINLSYMKVFIKSRLTPEVQSPPLNSFQLQILSISRNNWGHLGRFRKFPISCDAWGENACNANDPLRQFTKQKNLFSWGVRYVKNFCK